MNLNGIAATSTASNHIQSKSHNPSTNKSNSAENSQNTPSALYEKSETPADKKIVYKQDTATIAKLKADAEKRTQQLRNLVEKLMLKQGQTFEEANMYQLLREGKVPVDAETAAQAKLDIAEDGYWGIAQTSDRLVSFAKALTGGDPSKAEEMIAAVKKGFEQATKAWGADLPEISQKTFDATIEKLNSWKNSIAAEE